LEIQERVYSADRPLPDRLQHKSEYSISRLVKQAARWGSKQTEFLLKNTKLGVTLMGLNLELAYIHATIIVIKISFNKACPIPRWGHPL